MQENEFGKGAVKSPTDVRDVEYEKIAMGSIPFDWNAGFDIEAKLQGVLSDPAFRIVSKDQNGSSSCGGQAWGYLGAVLEAVATGTYEERSAKYIYAQTHAPGGGSGGRENSNLAIKQGWAKEFLCASYDAGHPPSEAFMERVSDITGEARADASKAKGLLYANVAINIDLFAQAIRDNNGMVLGIYGKNNGTWLSMFPKPPIDRGQYWSHWLYAGKAKMIGGKKYIAIKNSWGDNVGDKGWQWIGEDYFGPIPGGGDTLIWSGWTMPFKGEDPAWHYTFTESLKVGSKGDAVVALQHALKLEGMFTGTEDGKFGKITEASVKVFQTRYGLGADGKVGPKTNGKLNQLYALK